MCELFNTVKVSTEYSCVSIQHVECLLVAPSHPSAGGRTTRKRTSSFYKEAPLLCRCHYRGRCAGCQSPQVLGFHCWNTDVFRISIRFSVSYGNFEERNSTTVETVYTCTLSSTPTVCLNLYCTHISFSHLMVGDGSPTALQGSTISLIQGVVTVLLKVRIRAGAAIIHTCFISPQRRCSST